MKLKCRKREHLSKLHWHLNSSNPHLLIGLHWFYLLLSGFWSLDNEGGGGDIDRNTLLRSSWKWCDGGWSKEGDWKPAKAPLWPSDSTAGRWWKPSDDEPRAGWSVFGWMWGERWVSYLPLF